jgi:hypothetical protein
MGYSHDNYYRFKYLYEKSGKVALQEVSQSKACSKN